jgi:hypothetical protein
MTTGPDNPVRFVEAFVEQLDLQGAGFFRVEPKEAGRQGYHPGDEATRLLENLPDLKYRYDQRGRFYYRQRGRELEIWAAQEILLRIGEMNRTSRLGVFHGVTQKIDEDVPEQSLVRLRPCGNEG